MPKTDNGSCYKAHACRDLGLKHIRTKPYTPKTNGKAERFVQTALANGLMPDPMTTQTAEPKSCRKTPISRIALDEATC